MKVSKSLILITISALVISFVKLMIQVLSKTSVWPLEISKMVLKMKTTKNHRLSSSMISNIKSGLLRSLIWLSVAHFTMTTRATPVLTINSPDGDIIDCIRREAQPSFSHPLLQNHTFQERPSNLPNMVKMEDRFNWQIWHRNGTRCPDGSIPIRRIDGIANSGTEAETAIGHEYAIGFIKNGSAPQRIYGTKATMSVAHPKIERVEEFSLGQIWLVSGLSNRSDLNTMEAGWQVYPQLYSDHQPRLFIFWTNDGYNVRKCYNLRCPGFIQTSSTILIEGAIAPALTSEGRQTELTIQIWKDIKLGVWWLAVGFNNGTTLSPIGYWPTEILPRLIDHAERVEWGGEIINKNINGQHTTTEMGSGFFPSSKAAYMYNLEVAFTRNSSQPVYLMVGATNPKFYKIKKISNTSFTYGGPQRADSVHHRLHSLFYFSFIVFLLF